MSTVDKMFRRYLTSAADFERAGWEATEDRDKMPLWERAALAGMCAYLLKALDGAHAGVAEDIAEELNSFDQDGEDLSVWVNEQIEALPRPHQVTMCPGCLVRPLGHAEGECDQ